MLYLSFASYPEAKPFIGLLKLKKDMSEHRFEIFRSSGAALIISGEGSMEAAATVGFLLAKTEGGKNIFSHIRIDGSGKPGTIFLCNQILSPDGRIFYPDILFSHPFEECAENSPEAAGAFRAASMFLPMHRIFVFHVKSKPEFANESAEKILEWLLYLSENMPDGPAVFEAGETDLINFICRHFYFTQSMSLEFERLARFRKLRGDSIEKLLAGCSAVPCGGRQEGKKAFAELRKKLLDF